MRLVQGLYDELRKSRKIRKASGLAQREEDHDGLRGKPARDETEDLGGRPVEPLGIVHQADQRLLLGDIREQAEHSEPDQKSIWRRPCTESERCA